MTIERKSSESLLILPLEAQVQKMIKSDLAHSCHSPAPLFSQVPVLSCGVKSILLNLAFRSSVIQSRPPFLAQPFQNPLCFPITHLLKHMLEFLAKHCLLFLFSQHLHHIQILLYYSPAMRLQANCASVSSFVKMRGVDSNINNTYNIR